MVVGPTESVSTTQPHIEVDESELEREKEDPQEITEPFDPGRIKIDTKTVAIQQLITRIEDDALDLSPDFQRLRGIWNAERKSRLIESLLLKIPIPVFYVSADEDDRWSVVDGVQRISTIQDYVTGRFRLTRLQYLTWLNKRMHDDLPRRLQRRISETQIVVNVIDPDTPVEVMFNVFIRINTGGMTLNGQEIRHAINPGPARDYLQDLAQSDEFTRATDGSVREDRMADRECVLRFLAFHVQPWEKYAANDLDGYLGDIMKKINGMSLDERDEIAVDFKRAMQAAYDIFGTEAFRKPPGESNRRRAVNRALLEVWGVQLARCSKEQIDLLVEGRDEVRHRFTQLTFEDDEFDRAISYSTGTPSRIHKRFRAVQELVKEFV